MSEYIVRMPPDMPYEIKAELNAWYVESEPIVRCRDCEHFANWDGFEEFPWCVRHCIAVKPCGFCAWGERRTNDN